MWGGKEGKDKPQKPGYNVTITGLGSVKPPGSKVPTCPPAAALPHLRLNASVNGQEKQEKDKGKGMGKESKRDSEWICSNCSTSCFASTNRCFKCKTPKQSGGKGSEKVNPPASPAPSITCSAINRVGDTLRAVQLTPFLAFPAQGGGKPQKDEPKPQQGLVRPSATMRPEAAKGAAKPGKGDLRSSLNSSSGGTVAKAAPAGPPTALFTKKRSHVRSPALPIV
jgi:hypothetical protein